MIRITARFEGCRGERQALEDVVIEAVGIGIYEGVDLKDLAESMTLGHNAPSI